MGKVPSADDVRDLARLLGERAQNLFITRQMHCSEAVLLTLNRGLGGGLTDAQALALGTPFSEGIGNNGCLCGALSGALMAIGLFLGQEHHAGGRRVSRTASGAFLKRFKMRHGSTCCRVLSKSVRGDTRTHFIQCAELTFDAARRAAEVILEHRPGLVARAELEYLNARDTFLGGVVKSAARRVRGRLG